MIKDCIIGKDVTIIEPVNLYGCVIEDNCFIGPFVEIQNDCFIGKRTRISSHSFICEGTIIGQDCFIAHGVMFVNDLFNDSKSYKDFKRHKDDLGMKKIVMIGDNVRIGSNATILPVSIDDNVIIGAGTVVTKSIPSDCIVKGVPGRIKEL